MREEEPVGGALVGKTLKGIRSSIVRRFEWELPTLLKATDTTDRGFLIVATGYLQRMVLSLIQLEI